MALLHVLKGPDQGKKLELEGDKVTIGRDPPQCDIVIPMNAVSRVHAQILRIGERFYIEDFQSRNHTYVNNEIIEKRTLLRNNDKVRICDFLAVFNDGSVLPPLPPELAQSAEDEEDDNDASSTVEASLSHSNLQLETQPADKLKAMLEISASLSRTLELDRLLPKMVDSLFQLFKQADRCFIILAEEAASKAGTGTFKLIPKVIKTRRLHDEANARFSRTIVRKCLDTGDAFLSDDASGGVPLSQSVVDFRIRSVLCAPLSSPDGKPFGVIQLDTQDRTKKFTEDDLKLLSGVANQASIAMENAKLHEVTVARERLRRDLELAHQVQLSFLPSETPKVPGYDFFAHYEPALEVGGDYYDFIPVSGGRLAVLVGDVAGKGVPAALLMAKLSSDARFCLLTESDPARAITQLNALMYQHTSQMDRFVTLVAAVLDPADHSVSLVNAGHPSPLLYRASGTGLEDAMPSEATGVPLGILEQQEYPAHRVSLEAGDFLLLFTDGVSDSFNVRDRAFSTKGILAALDDTGAGSPQAAGARIIKAVKQHSAGRSQHDDITLVCLGRTGTN